ncbi:glycosyltransferase family 2 protein, partial [Patescibacteria group bacterium]|nr:glycosyltransferase family 2 protein [Patescibacteria group bacterium]
SMVFSASTFLYDKEIIIVDDGSRDGTEKILEELNNQNLCILKHNKNLGKGAAIRTGLKKATGDIVLIQDADLEYNPNDYNNILSVYNLQNPIIYGSRNIERKNRGYLFYSLGGKFLTGFFNLIYRTNLTDINTGLKLFRKDIIQGANLYEDGFDFCEEITAKVTKMGYKIKEVPINYYPRKFSQGKKIRFWHGFIGILTIIKYKFKEL